MNANNDNQIVNPDRVTFGTNMRAARESAGMSQRELAHELGRAQSVVSAWENGRLEPWPKPRDVFDLENATRIAPGTLSAHLGYVPAGATVTVEHAIANDPTLDDEARLLLAGIVRRLRN